MTPDLLNSCNLHHESRARMLFSCTDRKKSACIHLQYRAMSGHWQSQAQAACWPGPGQEVVRNAYERPFMRGRLCFLLDGHRTWPLTCRRE